MLPLIETIYSRSEGIVHREDINSTNRPFKNGLFLCAMCVYGEETDLGVWQTSCVLCQFTYLEWAFHAASE